MTTARPRTTRPLGSWHPAIVALASCYVVAVLWVTLRPLPWATDGNETAYGVLNPAAWLDLDAWISGRPLEFLANIAMFLPAGAFAGWLLRGPLRVIAPLAFTLIIELAQIPLDDRISHPRDLVANAVGAALGLVLVAVARRRNVRSAEPSEPRDTPGR